MIIQYGDVPRTIMQDELSRLMRKIIDNHIKAGQMASGKTAKSLRVEVNSDGEGQLVGRSFFGVLETGRNKGFVPRGFTAIIRQWMRDKGINADPIPYKTNRKHKYTPQERGNLTMAYFIGRKIREEGTAQFRKGARNDIYSKEIAEVKKRIVARFGEFIHTQIENIKLNIQEAKIK